MTPRGKGWSDGLLIRLLFTVPVSNAKLERTFSKLKRVRTNFHCSFGVKRLKNILRNRVAVGKLLIQFQQQRSGALIQLGAQPRRKDRVATSHHIYII